MTSPHSDSIEETVRYFMGVDLGQAHDPTAISVVRRVRVMQAHGNPKRPIWKKVSEKFQVGYLERIPLHTLYPAIVAYVGRLIGRGTWAGNVDVSIDQTGVGAPVADMFRSAGITFTGVLITGGEAESHESNVYRVPKLTLISQLQALLHEGKLQIQKDLPDAKALVRELQDFRVNHTDTGRMTFGAREGAHDDLVLSLAIAVWRATRPEHYLTVEPLRV